MDLIKALNKEQLEKEVPQVQVGDTVRVHVKVKEGARERIPVSYTHLMMRLNYWSYLASSWLAIMPGMVCFCILGNNLDFRNPVFWALLIADGLLILGALWYTRHKLGQSSKRT